MKHPKKMLALLLTAVFLLISVLGGCAGTGITEQKPEVINVSYALRPINVPSIVALEKKLFEEEFAKDGIEIKWYELEGPATIEALAAKSIDIATSLNYVSAIISKANGNDIKIISSYSRFPEAIGLVARIDSGVSSVADLKGKKIAFQQGTMLHEMFIRALEQAGLTEDDLEVVGMPSPEAANALLQGHVQAAILPDPLMMNVISSQKAKLVLTAQDLILGQAVIAARTDFLEKYPQLAERFLSVHQQILDWAAKNKDEVINLAAQTNQMPAPAVEKLYPKFDFSMSIDDDNISKLKESAEFLKGKGFIKEDTDTAQLIDQLVDRSYLP